MGIIEMVLLLAMVGVIVWAITTHIPMDAGIKKLIQIVVIVVCVLWVLQNMGLIGSINSHSANDVRIR